jgi:hypothetical protein
VAVGEIGWPLGTEQRLAIKGSLKGDSQNEPGKSPLIAISFSSSGVTRT